MKIPRSEFWDFAVRLYGGGEVAASCLALQQRHGVDVNLVLFCLWVASSGRGRLSAREMAEALAEVGAWHTEAVLPLRTLRMRLKGGFAPAPRPLSDALRRAVAALEIDAEHVEQIMLADTLARDPGAGESEEERARAAAANLSAYLARLGVKPKEVDRADASVLLAAAFPDLSAERIAAIGRLGSRTGS